MKKEYYECDVCGDTVEHYGLKHPEGWGCVALDGMPGAAAIERPTHLLTRDICPKHIGTLQGFFVRFNEREANGENLNPKMGHALRGRAR